MLNEEFTVESSDKEPCNLMNRYNREIRDEFDKFRDIVKVFEQSKESNKEIVEKYKAQSLVKISTKKLQEIYWDPKKQDKLFKLATENGFDYVRIE